MEFKPNTNIYHSKKCIWMHHLQRTALIAQAPICWVLLNSLWPSDDMWWQRNGSTLAQVMSPWIDADLSSVACCGIHMKAISQEVLINSICEMCSKITLLKLIPHLSEANDLIVVMMILFKKHVKDLCIYTYIHTYAYTYTHIYI